MIRKSPWHHHWNSTKTQALFRSRWWSRTTVGRYYLHGVHFSNLKYLGTEGVIRYWMDVEGGGYVLMRNVFQNPEPVATRLDDLHVTWTREVIHINESRSQRSQRSQKSLIRSRFFYVFLSVLRIRPSLSATSATSATLEMHCIESGGCSSLSIGLLADDATSYLEVYSANPCSASLCKSKMYLIGFIWESWKITFKIQKTFVDFWCRGLTDFTLQA